VVFDEEEEEVEEEGELEDETYSNDISAKFLTEGCLIVKPERR
jgi:hypothetical protein